MIHIQLDEVKRALPILAEEIRAGRDIIIEDQGQTVAYVQKTQVQKEEYLGSVIQRMRNLRPARRLRNSWNGLTTAERKSGLIV